MRLCGVRENCSCYTRFQGEKRRIHRDQAKDQSHEEPDAKIHTEILGSDHCPVELDLDK